MRSATSPTLPLGLILGTTALVAMGLGASAVSAQTPMQVSASVSSSCSIGSIDDLIFGAYEPGQAAPKDATGTIHLSCSGQNQVRIKINAGLLVDGIRRMNSGSDTLAYSLAHDGHGGTEWGDDGTTFNFPSHQVNASAGSTPVTVFGRIAGGLNPSPGEYSDTVLITLSAP